MRKVIVPSLACLIGIVVGLPLGVWAAPGASSFGSSLDRQAAMATSEPAGTSDTHWTDVPGLSGLTVCAQSEVTVTVSMFQVSGNANAMGLRVQVDDSTVLIPNPH